MLAEALVGIAATLLSAYIWETKIRDRVSVKRIHSSTDKDTEGLLDLYESLFPADGTNYSTDEILSFFDTSERHVAAENIVLVAKYHHDVVGFITCHFYPGERKAIISYYGINHEILEARRAASAVLLSRLKKTLMDAKHRCDYIFFDLQGIDSQTPDEEARKRKARPTRFRQSAKRFGLTAYLLQFSYACPKISMEGDSREYPFSLMCVPVQAKLPNPAPRSLILEFLRFIYHDCYGDLYPKDDERFEPYHAHLQRLLDHYKETLPEQIGAQ